MDDEWENEEIDKINWLGVLDNNEDEDSISLTQKVLNERDKATEQCFGIKEKAMDQMNKRK